LSSESVKGVGSSFPEVRKQRSNIDSGKSGRNEDLKRRQNHNGLNSKRSIRKKSDKKSNNRRKIRSNTRKIRGFIHNGLLRRRGGRRRAKFERVFNLNTFGKRLLQRLYSLHKSGKISTSKRNSFGRASDSVVKSSFSRLNDFFNTVKRVRIDRNVTKKALSNERLRRNGGKARAAPFTVFCRRVVVAVIKRVSVSETSAKSLMKIGLLSASSLVGFTMCIRLSKERTRRSTIGFRMFPRAGRTIRAASGIAVGARAIQEARSRGIRIRVRVRVKIGRFRVNGTSIKRVAIGTGTKDLPRRRKSK